MNLREIKSRLSIVALCAAIAMFVVAPQAASAQDITWNGGTGFWHVASNWTPAQIPNGFANVFIDGGNGTNSMVFLTLGASVDSLTIDAADELWIENGQTLIVTRDGGRPMSGMINNAGKIVVNSSKGGQTDLRINGDASLFGGGTLTLAGGQPRVLNFFGDHVLTNVDNTIEGAGRLGFIALKIINMNDGVIDANDSSGSLILDPPNVVSVTNENHGLMKASDGGDLLLQGGPLDNTNGVIRAENNSTVTLSGTDITNGFLQTTGTGVIEVPAFQTAWVSDVTLDGNIYMNNAASIGPSGTIDNQGTITVDSSNNGQTDLLLAGDEDVTLVGGGLVHLTGSGINARIWSIGGFTLTNVDNTIAGKGRIGANNTIKFINDTDGLVNANDISGSLILDPPNFPFVFENQGLITASDGGNLELRVGEFDNADGVIQAENGSLITLAGVTVNNGLLQSVGTGEIVVVSNSSIGDLTLAGTVHQNNLVPFNWSGTINNMAEVNVNSTGGQTDLNVSATVVTGNGSINLNGQNSRIMPGFLSWEMTGGTLRGIGQVWPSSLFHQNATIAPGNSVGTLTFLQPTEFGVGSSLEIEIEGTSSFDVVATTSSFTLGGDLVVLLSGFTPSANDTFAVVTTTGGITGSFANVANGASVVTSDGMGKFTANYGAGSAFDPNHVVLGNYQPILSLPATNMNIIRGVHIGGNVGDLATSDNFDVSVRRDQTLIQSVIEIEVESTTPVLNPGSFVFSVESAAFFRSTVIESVEFFDYDAGEFVEVDSRPASQFVDRVATTIAGGDLNRFVEDGTGKVKARVLFTSLVNRQTISANIDQVFWLID